MIFIKFQDDVNKCLDILFLPKGAIRIAEYLEYSPITSLSNVIIIAGVETCIIV
jgi:hypothetical protein